MTTTMSYRIATAAMTAFVVLSMWSQTLRMPEQAPQFAGYVELTQPYQPELA